MPLLTPRPTYAPFEYQQAYDYWEMQQKAHWVHLEVSMSSDINDWKTKLNETEKHVIGHILKGFTQSEVFIQEYWSQMVAKWFKIPEIQMMAVTFGAWESIHAVGYAYLNQSLGLEDYGAFLHEPTAKAKIDRLIVTKGKSKDEIARSLAIFSAFNEGVNLFSSFAILFNFSRFNKLKGIGQIISWSIRDECYSDDTEILTPSGWKLFSDLSDEDEVAQFDPATSEVSFVLPSRVVKKSYEGDLIHFSGEKLKVDQLVTPGHQMLFGWDNKPNAPWKFQRAEDLNVGITTKVVPVSGFKNSGNRTKLTPHEKFLIMTQADGSISGRYTGELAGTRPIKFGFSKQRKIDRFFSIMDETKYSFVEYPSKTAEGNRREQRVFVVAVPITEVIDKTLSWVELSDVTFEWASDFIEELVHWDGYVPTEGSGNYKYYSSVVPLNVDKVQAICALAGLWATRGIEVDDRSDTFSDVHRLLIHKMKSKRTGRITKNLVPYSGFVYCVTVPTGAIVVRRNGSVSVSGNCMHSEAGCWLFNTLIKEYPEIWTDDLKKSIYDAARLTIELEDDFIDQAFAKGEIEGLSSKDMKAFIRHRCNTKLQDIGLKSNWRNIDKEAISRMDWFDILSSGVKHTDFFAQRVTDYSKGNIDFSGIWDS